MFLTDIRLVAAKAFFSFPEVKRGLAPAMISAYIVPQLGTYKSGQYMLTGAYMYHSVTSVQGAR